MKVLMTGGGSGGHVSPALAVACVLLQRDPDIQLLFIGGKLTMEGSTGPSIEERLVRAENIPFQAIHAGKLPRQAFGIRTVKRLWGVVPGCVEAFAAVRRFSPDIVLSTGGYVSVPVVLAAAMLRIPVILHEQTAAVGLANQLAARVATKIAITFSSSSKFFDSRKVILTGNPIRPEILSPNKDAVESSSLGNWLQSSALPLIYITGGGLGSHIINETFFQLLPAILEQFRIVHQCGANEYYQDYEHVLAVIEDWPIELRKRYWPVKTLTADEVGSIYEQAAIVVARAGANTVLELAAWGIPTIFVPIPWVTHDEQTKNASVLVEAGTATIVPESSLSSARLAEAITDMFRHIEDFRSKQEQAKALVDLKAAEKLTDIVVDMGSRGKS
jgi:UDP-N-acetylglucosamine--N-acetylmuramyl-(pentapeptide) pyrophosphoryl-undecaprenol N-acetylglucosamine transferase